jgi:hypothetical protein
MGARIARIHTNALLAATSLKVIAAARDLTTKTAADFVAEALVAIIDPDIGVRREDSKGRVARVAARDRHSDKGVHQVESCIIVRTLALIAGSRQGGSDNTRGVRGVILDYLISRGVLLPVSWIFQGVLIDAGECNGILRDSKSCPGCRRGGRG